MKSIFSNNLVIAVLILMPPVSAIADVYKCKDSTGSTTFSQLPCNKGETSSKQKVYSSKSTPPGEEACLEARDFSGHLLTNMQKDKKTTDIISELGGINTLKPPVISIINYAAVFRNNKKTTPESLSSLVHGKCKNNGFGFFEVGDFPEWRQAWGVFTNPDTYPITPDMTPASADRQIDYLQKSKDAHNKNVCEQITRSLKSLREMMRNGYNSKQGEVLRKNEHTLTSERSKYCK